MKIFTGTSYLSGILIALLWMIPVTSVQAQLDDEQCRAKLNVYQRQLVRGQSYSKEVYGKTDYMDALHNINVYSTPECSHLAETTVYLYKDALQSAIRYCEVFNLGPTCGVTEAEINSLRGAPSVGNKNTQTESNNDSPPSKKITAAERKAQQAQQKAEDLTKKQQQSAQETQAKADAARQGKRKTNDQNYHASECVEIDASRGTLYGSIINKCNYKIWYTYCGYHPDEKSWLGAILCEDQNFGAGSINPLKRSASHTKHVEKIYWIACKYPAWPVDVEFVEGQGIKGRCRVI